MKTPGDIPPQSNGRCVVVGAAGLVGRSFANKLAESGWHVSGIDLCERPSDLEAIEWFCSDAGQLAAAARDAIVSATTVVAALPMKHLFACADSLLSAMRPRALFVETTSVKESVWRHLLPMTEHVEAVGINPMFSPMLGFRGRPVAWCALRRGPYGERLRKLIVEWGADIVDVSVTQHDQATSVCQVLVHSVLLAFGDSILKLDVDPDLVRRLSTPLSSVMLALLARLTGGAAATYWEIQRYNSSAEAARAAADTSLRELSRLVKANDEEGFAARFLGARDALAEMRDHYERQALSIFALNSGAATSSILGSS